MCFETLWGPEPHIECRDRLLKCHVLDIRWVAACWRNRAQWIGTKHLSRCLCRMRIRVIHTCGRCVVSTGVWRQDTMLATAKAPLRYRATSASLIRVGSAGRWCLGVSHHRQRWKKAVVCWPTTLSEFVDVRMAMAALLIFVSCYSLWYFATNSIL